MKPQLYIINAFDASKGHVVTFSWDGDQSFGNKCVIKNNKTNEVVYQQIQTTMILSHTIPANSLINGTLYNITITSIDVNGSESEPSTPMLFYCFTTPELTLDMQEGSVIRNSTCPITLNYNQIEGEPLQSYSISLYDVSHTVIHTSGVRYTTSNITYTLSDLEDNSIYYVQATGITLNGINISTPMISFSVNYIQPSNYALIAVENVKENGYIKLQSNVKSIQCRTNKTPVYIDNDYIDLKSDVLSLDQDFSLDGDFVLKLVGYDIQYGLIAQLHGQKQTISIYYRHGTYDVNNNVEKSYIELLCNIGTVTYRCASNYITPSNTLSVLIKRRNGLYSMLVR